MNNSRYQDLVEGFSRFKKQIILVNILCIIAFQILIAVFSNKILDYNQIFLAVLLIFGGLISLMLAHFLVLFIFKSKLKYSKEKTDFEHFISENKLKYPYLRAYLLSSFLVFVVFGLIAFKQIEEDIKKNSIEICCGRIYYTKHRIKRSTDYLYYKFTYKSKNYQGTTTANLHSYTWDISFKIRGSNFYR